MFFYEDEHSPLLIQGSRRKLQIFPEYNDIDPSECNDALFFIVPWNLYKILETFYSQNVLGKLNPEKC